MSGLRSVALLGCALLLVGATAGERAARARAQAEAQLARGDRAAALAALRGIAAADEAPEGLLAHAALLVALGEAARAVWLLEAGVRRHPAREDLRLAKARLELLVNDPRAARETARAISPRSAEHPAALLVLAQAELELGSLEGGLAILEQAEREYPDRPEARLARIRALALEHRLDEARTLLEETRRRFAGEEPPPETRAMLRQLDVALWAAQAKTGAAEIALRALQAATREDPGDLQAWQALIHVFGQVKRPREGLELVLAAIEQDPELHSVYGLGASANLALGRPEAGERLLLRLLERAPTPSAYAQLAAFYAARRDPARVLATYANGAAAFTEDPFLARLHAEALVDAGRLADARRELTRFRKLAPRDPHVEFLRARLALAEGDAADARARLEKLVPELDEAYTQYWLGRALAAQGDRAGAERRYALALARNPTDVALYAPLLEQMQRRGDWRETAKAAEQLVRHAPGLPEGWSALATALVNLGAGEEAEKVSRHFAELFPDEPTAALSVARALRVRGQHDQALDELDRAEQRLGSSVEIAAERALTLGLAGRVDEATESARRSLAARPDAAVLHATLASLRFAAGDGDEGTRAVDRGLALDPSEPSPLRRRAEFLAAAGRLDEARRDCERYLALRPDDSGAHFALGVILHRTGRRTAAAAAYRRAAELDQQAFAPRNNLALLLADSDLPAALDAASEAYARAADDPDVLDTLGWLYLRAGRVERAISFLEDAHRGAPVNLETKLHLALAYREAGRAEDARRLLLMLREAEAPASMHARAEEALRSLP